MKKILAGSLFGLLTAGVLQAQGPQQISPDVAAQLILQAQPLANNSPAENVSATAEFDPPAVSPGEKTFYRVTVHATQNSITWPSEISAPPALPMGAMARGQFTQPDGVAFHPFTQFIYEVTPAAAGQFSISNFLISVGGQRVEVPAAMLTVQTQAGAKAPRKLLLEFSETNLFFGQPFRARVLLPASAGKPIEALRDVQFSGGGLLVDKYSTRLSATAVQIDGQLKPAFAYEVTLTPMNAGQQTVSAQAFTAPLFSAGPISITSVGGPIVLGGAAQTTPMLLVSAAWRLNIRPLPEATGFPGFTGAIGKFTAEKPMLSTNRIRLGEPVQLKFGFTAGTNLVRFVPPEMPHSRKWQIIVGKPGENIFTLIPLTDEMMNTPAIPFSAFDPETRKYRDLTIPSLPVTVIGDGLPVELHGYDELGKSSVPTKLSALATVPGQSVAHLQPPQLRSGMLVLGLLPVLVLVALWRWDEQRRFLEAHPEIVRRRQAKRDLSRERKNRLRAVRAGDEQKFLMHSVAAMQLAVAPHFPATARAMVCGDVLSQLDPSEREGKEGETVRKVFAATDGQYSGKTVASVLLAAAADVESVLRKLEEKL